MITVPKPQLQDGQSFDLGYKGFGLLLVGEMHSMGFGPCADNHTRKEERGHRFQRRHIVKECAQG
jgi:hypothetical protein